MSLDLSIRHNLQKGFAVCVSTLTCICCKLNVEVLCRKKFKSQYVVAPHILSFALASWVNADVKLQQLTPCL